MCTWLTTLPTCPLARRPPAPQALLGGSAQPFVAALFPADAAESGAAGGPGKGGGAMQSYKFSSVGSRFKKQVWRGGQLAALLQRCRLPSCPLALFLCRQRPRDRQRAKDRRLCACACKLAACLPSPSPSPPPPAHDTQPPDNLPCPRSLRERPPA